MKLAALAALVLACGPSSHPAPPTNHPTGGPSRTDQAIALLHQLADVARADGSLAPLGDPIDGVWLWEQPGVAPVPTAHAAPNDAHKLSEVLASGGLDGARAHAWVGDVADQLAHGLGAMDVDADPAAPAYNVDCGAVGGLKPATRGLLTTHGVDLKKEHRDLDPGGPVEKMTTPVTMYFWFNAVEVYFSERDGKLYVADVIVSTPCEV
jgi:hypothetical protein